MTHLPSIPPLPQEIINIIIGEIASAKPHNESLTTLRACSLVSTTFHFHSRKHLFSEIKFIVDDFSPKRVARLVKVLKHNKDLLSSIRSINIVFDMRPCTPHRIFGSAKLGRLHQKSRLADFYAARKLGLKENSVIILLKLFTGVGIEKLSLDAQHGLLNWAQVSDRIKDAIDRIYSKPSLESLRFINIYNLPHSFVTGELQSNSLHELSLCDVRFMQRTEVPSPETCEVASRNLARIERLTMIYSPYMGFFQVLRPFLNSVSASLPLAPPAISFSHLKTISVSIPLNTPELQLLFQFILGAARSLEMLELQDITWTGANLELLAPDYLSRLVALRTMKFKVRGSEHAADGIKDQLYQIDQFLATATSPVGIQFITVEIYMDMDMQDRQPGTGTNTISWIVDRSGGWSDLDQAFTNPMLVALQTVSLNLKLFYHDREMTLNQFEILKESEDDVTDFQTRLLPDIKATPSVKFNVNIESVFSGAPLVACLHWISDSTAI
ncbi:hypothetical protein BDZ97DRAFT_1328967 [Flammula alnicola]|nr:hypothetical protein BDZ97DRAFT_1328967 [Flammula alnicola]